MKKPYIFPLLLGSLVLTGCANGQIDAMQMRLNQQEQQETLTAEVRSLNEKMQLMMEQMVLANRNRFGRSSEKMEDASQISFMEVDGTIVFFNEAEAVCNLDAPEPEQLEVPTPRPVKKKGKKEQDMLGLPIERIDHYMTEEELTAEFGKNGWKQLPDATPTVLFPQRWK